MARATSRKPPAAADSPGGFFRKVAPDVVGHLAGSGGEILREPLEDGRKMDRLGVDVVFRRVGEEAAALVFQLRPEFRAGVGFLAEGRATQRRADDGGMDAGLAALGSEDPVLEGSRVMTLLRS